MKLSPFSLRYLLAPLAAALLLSGCRAPVQQSVREQRRSRVARPTADAAKLPFNRAWQKPSGVQWEKYTQIVIAPTNTEFFALAENNEFWADEALANRAKEDAAALSKQITSAIKAAFEANPDIKVVAPYQPARIGSFSFQDDDAPKTLFLNTALLELTPNKQTAGLLGPVNARQLSKAVGSVALEVHISDFESTELLATLSDRELAPSGGGDNWHAHATPVIDAWAQQLSDAIGSMKAGEPVGDITARSFHQWNPQPVAEEEEEAPEPEMESSEDDGFDFS